jgi:hypothetical protein
LEIRKEMVLNYTRKGNELIFDDLRTLSLAMGTTSVVGNLHVYDVEKRGKQYVYDINKLQERYEVLCNKLRDLEMKIDIMKQILEANL